MIKISSYSGKCDCYDTLVAIHQYTEEQLKNNVKIYVGDSSTPLHIESYKDLIPYYPYIIGSAYFNNEEKSAVIHLSSESFVDMNERERLELYLKLALKEYNKCKRTKTEFVVENVVNNIIGFSDWNKKEVTELVKKVVWLGKNATIEGIHLRTQEHYRRKLVNEMIKNGLDPIEYGYGRFVEEVGTY